MQKITFATNTSTNTLAYVKLLLRSLKENLDGTEHQILMFVDSDNEGTLEYLLSIKDSFFDMSIIVNAMGFPTGYQRNTTLITEYANHDIISYLQSDMVVGPHYDTEILKHIKRGRILSSTRVEPPLHGESYRTHTVNLGLRPDEFDFEKWNNVSRLLKREDTLEYFFAPITYYKEDWMRIGGYDTVFRRAREDSDFVQRCLHAGIELVQTFSANAYHFTCVSSRGKDWFDQNNLEAKKRTALQSQADAIELRRFVRKWGNFNHGEEKLFKLDVDLVALNVTSIEPIRSLEPFFTRVWMETQQLADNLIEVLSDEHVPANSLLDATDEQWDTYSHLFRTDDFTSIIKVGTPDTYSIKVTIDLNKFGTVGQSFLNNIQHMYEMLREYEAGEYELDGVSISIVEPKVLPTPIVAQNPPFDHTLLTVY